MHCALCIVYSRARAHTRQWWSRETPPYCNWVKRWSQPPMNMCVCKLAHAIAIKFSERNSNEKNKWRDFPCTFFFIHIAFEWSNLHQMCERLWQQYRIQNAPSNGSTACIRIELIFRHVVHSLLIRKKENCQFGVVWCPQVDQKFNKQSLHLIHSKSKYWPIKK